MKTPTIPKHPPEQAMTTFIGLVRSYFQAIGGSAPKLLDASLEWTPPPRFDKTGYMPVSGVFDGWIALSLPDAMLRRLLTLLGETLHDEANLLDLVAEITSVITSNARAHFGEHLRLAPAVACRSNEPAPLPHPPVSFKLPFRWHDEEGFLLVALTQGNDPT